MVSIPLEGSVCFKFYSRCNLGIFFIKSIYLQCYNFFQLFVIFFQFGVVCRVFCAFGRVFPSFFGVVFYMSTFVMQRIFLNVAW